MSTKGRILRALSKLVLTEGVVKEANVVSRDFRLLKVQSQASASSRWQPGDKVQVLLPTDDVRTLTPIYWDTDGTTALLVYMHGEYPLARWARSVEAGESVRFVGPSRSLVMPSGALTLVGDETSIAVGASYARTRPGQVRVLIEADANGSLEDVLRAVELGGAQVVPRELGMRRGEAVANALSAVNGAVGITGGAEFVQRVRERVRGLGASSSKTKAYWLEGRPGLD